MNGMLKSLLHQKIAALGKALHTLWYVEQMNHAAMLINVSMPAGSTELAMFILEDCIMVSRTCLMRSQMAFACGFSSVIGLRFMPYELHNISKCNLNSEPLSYIRYRHLGYLHYNYILFTTNRFM